MVYEISTHVGQELQSIDLKTSDLQGSGTLLLVVPIDLFHDDILLALATTTSSCNHAFSHTAVRPLQVQYVWPGASAGLDLPFAAFENKFFYINNMLICGCHVQALHEIVAQRNHEGLVSLSQITIQIFVHVYTIGEAIGCHRN